MFLQAILQVFDAFGDVDVVTHAVRFMFGSQGHRFVADGKLGMHAHHAGNHVRRVGLSVADPGFIFQDCLAGFVLTVAVGDFVAQTRADAQFLRCLADGKEAVLDFTKTGVMVEDRRHAVLDTFDIRFHSAQISQVVGQMTVDIPPQAVEDVQEALGRIAVDIHTPGHGAVNMLVNVDESRHDDTAFGIDKSGVRIGPADFRRLADAADYRAVYGYGAIREILILRVAGNDVTISDD